MVDVYSMSKNCPWEFLKDEVIPRMSESKIAYTHEYTLHSLRKYSSAWNRLLEFMCYLEEHLILAISFTLSNSW